MAAAITCDRHSRLDDDPLGAANRGSSPRVGLATARRAAAATGYVRTEMSGSIQSLENVGIVVDDLAEAKAFFVELGLEQVGETEVAGEWVDRVVGLEDVRCELSMLQTPDGHGRLELMRFNSPAAREGDTNAPPNTLGIRRIAFSVDDIDAAVARLRDRGLELLGEVVRYEDIYRLCYVRGPEGIIVMLAERIG
jgi:catechol 2,3-dioxygenase-like lactoylglutathione lyase family enzyme